MNLHVFVVAAGLIGLATPLLWFVHCARHGSCPFCAGSHVDAAAEREQQVAYANLRIEIANTEADPQRILEVFRKIGDEQP